MAILIVDQPGRRFGGRLNGRVLIGRLPTNGVWLPDSSVSRLHAWIDTNGGGRHFIADTGSLTGTWVNGLAIVKRRDLNSGDVIKVGKIQLSYTDGDTLPDGVEPVDLGGTPPAENVEEAGVLFNCPCGSPAWVKASAIGHNHQCKQCGRTVRVPERSGETAQEISPPPVSEPGIPQTNAMASDNPMLIHDASMGENRGTLDEHGLTDAAVEAAVAEPVAPPIEELPPLDEALPTAEVPDLLTEPAAPVEPEPARQPLFVRRAPVDEALEVPRPSVEEPIWELESAEGVQSVDPVVCGVCHNPIDLVETQTTCPSCGLTFHAECWKENLGCSSYGCPKVNCLQPAEAVEATEAAEEPVAVIADEEDAGFPWEFVFLIVSVLGALLGALSYGVPAMIGFLGTLIYIAAFQHSRRRRPIVWFALLLYLAGAGLGVYVSYLYWRGWPPIGPWAHHVTPHAMPAGIKR